jgi:hypothetical protein
MGDSLQISFPLPNTPNTKVHLNLTTHQHAIVLFITTSAEVSAGSCPLGSFVYAIPNVGTLRNTLKVSFINQTTATRSIGSTSQHTLIFRTANTRFHYSTSHDFGEAYEKANLCGELDIDSVYGK